MAKYLVNTARTLIFSTALSPPAVAAALAALELLREQPRRVEKLQRNARVLREALAAEGLPVPRLGDADRAADRGRRRRRRARPASGRSSGACSPRRSARRPSRRARSRLRLAVMASHTKSELREAAGVLAARVPAVGARGRPARGGRRQEPERGRVFDGLRDAA